jgi:DNA-binding MarR family transcriptional regulator
VSWHTDERTAEVVGLIGEIIGRVNREYERASGTHQLTPVQAKALGLLTYKPLRMRRIAELLQCDPSNVTGIVDRLVARGLVTREPDPSDRRVKRIALTGRGQSVADDLGRSMDFAARPLAALTPEDQTLLRDLLAKLVRG